VADVSPYFELWHQAMGEKSAKVVRKAASISSMGCTKAKTNARNSEIDWLLCLIHGSFPL
jgi:hypothetical protein